MHCHWPEVIAFYSFGAVYICFMAINMFHGSPSVCRVGSQSKFDGTVLGPALTVGMLVIGPDDSQALFSLSHWHWYNEVRFKYCSSCALGPTVGSMKVA